MRAFRPIILAAISCALMDLAPDATTPSKLTPEYPPIGVLPLHDLRASVSGYCSRLTREVLAQSAIVSIPPYGRSVGPSNRAAFRTNACRLSASSFFLSCQLMFTTVL